MIRLFVLCLLTWSWERAAFATYVVSPGDCPAEAAISTRLSGLVSGQEPSTARATVAVKESRIHIELVLYGERPRERIIPAKGSCAEQAESVALVIAAWLDSLPASTVTGPAELPKADPAPTGSMPVAPVPTGTPPTPPRAKWVGLEIGGAWDPVGLAGQFAAEWVTAPLLRQFGSRIKMGFPTSREIEVGQGQGRVYQPTLHGAVQTQFLNGAFRIMPSLGPTLGLVIVQGRNFDRDRTSIAWRLGAEGEARILRVGTAWVTWFGMGMIYWPKSLALVNIATNTGKTLARTALPHWELHATLGMGFDFF